MTRLSGEALRKQAARQAVNALVRRGDIPHPRDSFCFDCRGDAAQYDHYRGYEGDAILDVQPVCVACHGKRSAARGERVRTSYYFQGETHEPGLNVRLSATREGLGLSVEEAATRRGIKPDTWSHYESRSFTVHRGTVARLAQALGVPFEQLWGRPHVWDERYRAVPLEARGGEVA